MDNGSALHLLKAINDEYDEKKSNPISEIGFIFWEFIVPALFRLRLVTDWPSK